MVHLRKLFDDRPDASDPSFIKETFVNREKELLVCTDFLGNDLFGSRLNAIFGYSRLGKSHLAMRVAQDLVAREHCLFFYGNTQLLGSAYDILSQLFNDISKKLTEDKLATKDKRDELTFLQAYSKLFEQAVAGIAQVQVSEINELSRGLSASFKAKIPFTGVSAGLSGNKGSKQQSQQTTTYSKPDLNGLQRIITFLLDGLAEVSGKKILILLDDMDLLNDEDELDLLQTELKKIAQLPVVAFLLTVRTNFLHQNSRDFFELVNLDRLKANEIEAIYKKRIELYHDGFDFLEPEVLNLLSKGLLGLVGSFFSECSRIYKEHIVQIKAKRKVSRKDLDTFLLNALQGLYEDPETAPTIQAIATAVQNKQVEFKSPTRIPEGSGLLYRIVQPRGFASNTYEILPLYRETLAHFKQETPEA